MGQHAYAATNALAGLGAAAFTWSSGATADRDKLNDGRMDARFAAGSVASGVNVIIDFGSARSLVGFAVLNCNLALAEAANTPKLLIEAADDAGISVNKVTPKALTTLYTATVPRCKDHVLQFAAVSKRYWRLTWSWSGGGSTAFFVGELFAYSAASLLTRRSIYGSGEQQGWIVEKLQMQYGTTRGSLLGGPIRQFNLNWADMTASERDELQGIWAATSGGAAPFLWIQSYEAVATAAAVTEQDCLFARLSKPAFVFNQNDFAIYTPDSFSLISEGREAGS